MSSEYFSLDQEVYKLCEYLTLTLFREGEGVNFAVPPLIEWFCIYFIFLASIQTKNVIQISL